MKLLDVVATTSNLPDQHLVRGQVGTVVEELSTNVMLVEFADLSGVAYAIEPVAVDNLMELMHAPEKVAA